MEAQSFTFSKSIDTPEACIGTRLTYTIEIFNSSGTTYQNVDFIDVLPQELLIVGITNVGLGTLQFSILPNGKRQLKISNITLPPALTTFTFTVILVAEPAQDYINNQAQLVVNANGFSTLISDDPNTITADDSTRLEISPILGFLNINTLDVYEECDQEDTFIPPTGTDPSYSYNWIGPANFNSNQSSLQISNFEQENEGLYILYTNNDNCEIDIDSIFITYLPPVMDAAALQVCGTEYTFPDGTVASTDGDYPIRIDADLGSGGCDTIRTFQLEFSNTLSDTLKVETCAGVPYTFFSNQLSSSGLYSETILNFEGACDSTVVLELTVSAVLMGFIDTTICANESYLFDGQTITQSGEFTSSTLLQTNSGCDSLTTLNLTVLAEIETILNEETCTGSGFNFNGDFLTDAGTYSQILSTFSENCDSLVTLNLTVTPPLSSTTASCICSNEVIEFGTQSINTAGTFTENIPTSAGCDSLVTLNLTVEDCIGCTLVFPTAFSPNNDGVNDNFGLLTSCNVPSDIKIFNRWGNLIFEVSNSTNIQWDGTLGNGETAPIGVYTFFLESSAQTACGSEAETTQIAGQLTLIR